MRTRWANILDYSFADTAQCAVTLLFYGGSHRVGCTKGAGIFSYIPLPCENPKDSLLGFFFAWSTQRKHKETSEIVGCVGHAYLSVHQTGSLSLHRPGFREDSPFTHELAKLWRRLGSGRKSGRFRSPAAKTLPHREYVPAALSVLLLEGR